jgi:hypothetical protein
VAPFDFLRGSRASPRQDDGDWQVRVDGGLLLIESSHGETIFHANFEGARWVRVVPLSGGSHHVHASGWQVTLSRGEGDVLLGPPLASWQSARELARNVCGATHLPMDELTERLFSRVSETSL